MDAVASLYGRNSLNDIIESTAREIFIPFTVAGGLRSIEDIRSVLRAGADKVALNTAVINRPELITEAAEIFGSSTIMVSIEAIKRPEGYHEAYTDGGRQMTGVDAREWAERAAKLGAGELMVTSIDREGTGKGFDLELTRSIAEAVSIPVIACGGAGTIENIYDVITQGKADAVSVASIIHYGCFDRFRYDDLEFSSEGNIEYMRRRSDPAEVQGASIQEIKQYLMDRGIECRPCAGGPPVG
jgi:cyclase